MQYIFFHDINYYHKFQQNQRWSCQIAAQNWFGMEWPFSIRIKLPNILVIDWPQQQKNKQKNRQIVKIKILTMIEELKIKTAILINLPPPPLI